MIAENVMTTAPVTVNEHTPILEVVSLLLNLKISGLPVLNGDGVMVGIVTEGDLLRRSELGTEIKRPHWKELFYSPGELAKEYVQSHACYANEVMTTKPLTVTPEMPLDEVISLMESNKIKRVPVVREGKLVGIITRADILKALRTILVRDHSPEHADDYHIKKEIIHRIHNQHWAPKSRIRVNVTNGVVEIYGTILDENLRTALITLIEEVTGNCDVQDHLVFVEPITGLFLPKNG
ncbi:CBS domain-containing protein [Aeromonas finlandensis]|uniref:CBS domain-containing protein n=1 Tax=Aeromonas finlandensis TaxID=1543375 RepID=UPI00051B7BC3|nr:CBS domain-containing protein [Aeromonas finlandensis]